MGDDRISKQPGSAEGASTGDPVNERPKPNRQLRRANLRFSDGQLDRLGRQVMSNQEAEEVRDRARLLGVLVEHGMCVHSFFCVDCSGCRERELRRALAALVEVRRDGFSTPIHGLSPRSEEDVWEFADAVLGWTDVP